MAAPDDSPPRIKFTIGQVMAFIAALAFLLAGLVVRDSVILMLIGFFILTQLLLRMLFLLLPTLGSVMLGIGRQREESEETKTRMRELTRAAASLCHAGNYTAALETLLAAEAIRSGDVWNALAQAWCLRKLGRLDESLEPLERTEIHTPFDPLLQYALACHWSQAGTAPRALDALATALEFDPDLRECAIDEPDLEGIRGEEGFSRVVDGLPAAY